MDHEYTDGFYLIGESPLEVDEEEDEVRAEYLPSIEEALKLLGRDNRVSIAARRPVPTLATSLPPDQAAYDITLMLALHPHPECKFKWSHLVVDLTPTPGAKIQDMAPGESIGEPSEVEIKVGTELRFKIPMMADVQLTPEVTRKHTTRFPTVSASGQGTEQAWWTFQSGEGDCIPSSRELRLLVSAPAHAPVMAKFSVRAEVGLRGWKNLFPLRAKHGDLDIDLLLVPASHPAK